MGRWVEQGLAGMEGQRKGESHPADPCLLQSSWLQPSLLLFLIISLVLLPPSALLSNKIEREPSMVHILNPCIPAL